MTKFLLFIVCFVAAINLNGQTELFSSNFANCNGWALNGNFYCGNSLGNCPCGTLPCYGYAYLSGINNLPGDGLIGYIQRDVTTPGYSLSHLNLVYQWNATSTQIIPNRDTLRVEIQLLQAPFTTQKITTHSIVGNISCQTESFIINNPVFLQPNTQIRIKFLGKTDNSQPSTMRLDNISLTAFPCTNWQISSSQSASCPPTGGSYVVTASANSQSLVGCGYYCSTDNPSWIHLTPSGNSYNYVVDPTPDCQVRTGTIYVNYTGYQNNIASFTVNQLGNAPPTSPTIAYANGSSGSIDLFQHLPLTLSRSGGFLGNGVNPQWQWSDDGCKASLVYPNTASNGDLYFPPNSLQPGPPYTFWVWGENDCGESPNCASVNVNILPCDQITLVNLTPQLLPPAQVGGQVVLQVSVTGGANTQKAYAWYKGTQAIPNNSPILNLYPVSMSDAGDYSCIVTNCYGSKTSNTVSLIVNCANWTNTFNDPIYKNKYEYLCNLGILNSSTAKLPEEEISRLDLAIAIKKTLETVSSGYTNYANNFPTPFLDIDVPNGADAIRMMLYLDYGDNVPPFTRDYFNVQPNLTFNNGTGAGSNISFDGIRGAGLRALFEAFNISTSNSWLGYNPNSNTNSFADIKENNPYYGYYKKALELNWIPLVSGNIDQQKLSYRDVVTALYSIKHDNIPSTVPSVIEANYFVPNNFTKANSASAADISRGCFSNYSEDGISINRGGIPIEFKPIYNSHLFEIPKAGIWLDDSLKFFQEVAYPLGQGWTHSLNPYIIVGISSNDPSLNSYFIHWPDGRIHVVNYSSDKTYITQGVTDVLSVVNSNLVVTTIDKTQYIFSQSNISKIYRLIQIKDRNNNSLFLSYNTNVLGYSLKGVKNEYSGDSIRVYCGLNGNSRLIDSVEFSDKKLKFKRFNDFLNLQRYGDLDTFINAKNAPTYYTYSSNPALIHLLTKVKLPKGNEINNDFTSRRRLSKTQFGNYVTNITFNTSYLGSNNNSTQSTVEQTTSNSSISVTTNYTHNNNGLPTVITPSNNSNITTTYSTSPKISNLPLTVLDANTGITNSYTYDQNTGNMLTHNISKPGSTTMTESWHYDAATNIWDNHTDMNGVITTRTLDGSGNALTINNSAGNLVVGSSGTIQTTVNYNPQGQPVSSFDGNTALQYGYNSSSGLLTSVSIPAMNIISTAGYDFYGRLTSITNPKGVKDSTEYDLNDNVTKTIQDVGGFNLTTTNTYDPNDNVLSITAPKGDQTDFTYDFDYDYLTKIQYGAYSQTMAYNQDGSLKTLTNKNNHQFNYSYYATGDSRAGMLQSDGYKILNVSPTTKWLDDITNSSNNTITYSYDGYGRATNIVYNDVSNNEILYEYDKLRLKKIIYPFSLGEQTMDYDPLSGLLQYVKWNGVTMVEYKYRGDKNLLEEIYYSKIHKLYYYDNAARLDSVVYKKQNGTKLAGFKIQKDAVGNLTYDSAYVNYSNPTVQSYTFGGVNTRSYDNMNRCTSYSTQGSTFTNTYTNNGCLDHFGALNADYTYDQQDNMLSRTINGGTPTNMTVDPLENRRAFGNTRYFLDLLNHENVLAEKNTTTNQFSDIYLYGFTKFCRIDPISQAPAFYLTDYRGSVIAIVDANENISHYYYYQNGVQGRLDSSYVSSSIGFPNNTLFVGGHGVITHDSSLVYMKARYFNPMIGNFYSEDPIWNTNLFSYANSNSGYIDPNGESLLLLALGTGAAIGAGLEITDYLLSTKRSEITFKGLLLATAKGGTTGAASVINPLFGKAVGATWDGNEYAKNSVGIKQFAGNFAIGFSQSYALSYIGGNSSSMNNTANFLVKKMNVNSPVKKYVAKKIIKGINDKIIDEVKGTMFNKILRTTIKYY